MTGRRRASSQRRILADAETPASGDSLQVLGSLGRRDESQVPGILGGALELDVVEPSGETEQHPRRRGDAQPVVALDDIASRSIHVLNVARSQSGNAPRRRVLVTRSIGRFGIPRSP